MSAATESGESASREKVFCDWSAAERWIWRLPQYCNRSIDSVVRLQHGQGGLCSQRKRWSWVKIEWPILILLMITCIWRRRCWVGVFIWKFEVIINIWILNSTYWGELHFIHTGDRREVVCQEYTWYIP